MVEIGYEVIEPYRNKGFATEIALALVKNAFEYKDVNLVQAHTLADKNPSTKVLVKCGFQWVEEVEEEEDGTIWKWELKRSDFNKR
jgi:RimJ/RimL family protein N-acetyltransferase